jgi:MerR family mercuric resistance operon transcriptional regulator
LCKQYLRSTFWGHFKKWWTPYPPEQVKRLRFNKGAQALGFTLDELGALLILDGACTCSETWALAVRKLALIERKMADLAAMRQVLGGLVQKCDVGGRAACPIIDVLNGE